MAYDGRCEFKFADRLDQLQVGYGRRRYVARFFHPATYYAGPAVRNRPGAVVRSEQKEDAWQTPKDGSV
jgi:hypothetical protein